MSTLSDTFPTEADSLNETALRILNLLFALNASAEPLTTEQIVSDSDLGYGSGNRASDLKKFKRDREKLAERGIRVVEVCPEGAAQNEESRWAIDRADTYAALGIITPHDAATILRAIDECLGRDEIPFRGALLDIRQRLCELMATDGAARPGGRGISADETTRTGAGILNSTDSALAHERRRNPAVDALWTAFALKRKIRFAYVDAKGTESQRVISIWGVFMQHGHSYFVGLDEQTRGVRTFRADRIVRAWRPSGSYTVPSWFDVREYLFLPFDMAGGMATPATFRIGAGAAETQVQALTNGRGTLERAGESGPWTWTVKVSNTDAAARFALAHAQMGMRPLAPDALVKTWKNLIGKAVAAHAR